MSPEGVKLRWDHPAAATLGQKVAPDKDASPKLDGTETKHPALSPASAYLLVQIQRPGSMGGQWRRSTRLQRGKKVREWVWKNKCKITNINKESKHLQVGCSVS